MTEHDALIAGLERIGKNAPRAKTLAVVHTGLSARSTNVDLDGWNSQLAGSSYPAVPPERAALESTLDNKAAATEASI